MKLFVIFLCFLCCSFSYAQKVNVKGFVIDKTSKQRLAKVYIYNSRSDEGLYNNSKGEFSTIASVGDTLFAMLQGYGLDTVIYKGNNAIYFQLRPLAVQLREVAIVGSSLTPRERYDKTLKEYKYATERGSSRDLLNLGPSGVGLGIDAIYNLLSRKGRNARHLQDILERDYKEQIIDFRFNPTFVGRALRIKGFELEDFMQQYRPSYDFVLVASDYAFIVFLKNNYATYQRNPNTFRLKSLPKIKIEQL